MQGRRGDGDKKEWVPVTKLGRLVKAGLIASLEQIYVFSLAIKEFEIEAWQHTHVHTSMRTCMYMACSALSTRQH